MTLIYIKDTKYIASIQIFIQLFKSLVVVLYPVHIFDEKIWIKFLIVMIENNYFHI